MLRTVLMFLSSNVVTGRSFLDSTPFEPALDMPDSTTFKHGRALQTCQCRCCCADGCCSTFYKGTGEVTDIIDGACWPCDYEDYDNDYEIVSNRRIHFPRPCFHRALMK